MNTPIPTRDQVNLVLYHRDLDGFAAGWAAWKYLGDKAEYIDVQYGEEVPDVTGKHVAIVDFSYKPEPMAQLVEQAASLVVLDHHPSVLKEHPDGHPNFIVDLDRSGAMLSWFWFHPEEGPQDALYLVQDYDLWRWELLDTRAFHYGIQHIRWKPEFFGDFDQAIGEDYQDTLYRGKVLCDYVDAQLQSGVKKGTRVLIADTGVEAWMFNGHAPWYSELGHALVNQDEGPDVALIWSYLGKYGTCACSLRSREGGTNVGELSRSLGGGGHRHAGGFTWRGKVEDLFTVVEDPDSE